MDFEEFREKLRNDLPGVLPEDMQNVSIDFQHTEKLQNGSYEGIVVKPEEQNVVMNIDMGRFYEKYENGMTYDEDMLRDYDQMKSMFSIQVVPTEPNMDMLQNISHKEMEDTSVNSR